MLRTRVTVRHVFTECQATKGLRPFADQMAKHCRSTLSDIAGERANGQATGFVELAKQGWEAVAGTKDVTTAQWKAMNALASGVAPIWRSGQGSSRAPSTRAANNVAARVESMQELVSERRVAHRGRAARVTKWIKEREEAQPLLRVIMQAWSEQVRRGVLTRSSDGTHTDEPQHLTHDEWKKWRAKERPSDQRARRMSEQIKFLRFASVAHAKQFRKLRANTRLARCLRLHLRKRLVAARWHRAGRRVCGRVMIANAARDGGRRKRSSTALHTVWSASRVTQLQRKAGTGSRVTRPHLTRAAVVGKVVEHMIRTYMNLGDG